MTSPVLAVAAWAHTWVSVLAATPRPTPGPPTTLLPSTAPAPGPTSITTFTGPARSDNGWLDWPGQVASGGASHVLDGLVDILTTGFIRMLSVIVTSWTNAGYSGDALASITNDLSGVTRPLTLAAGTIGVMIAGTRMVVSSRGAQESGRDLIRGLMLIAIFGTGATGLVAGIQKVFDDATKTITDRMVVQSPEGLPRAFDFMVQQSPGLMLILMLVGILSMLIQFIIVLLREPVLILITGMLPIAAASSMTGTGRAWLTRLLSWTGAFITYKFFAALIYYAAFTSLLEAAPDETGVQRILVGITLLILSVAVLPAILRLLAPAAIAIQGGGGGNATTGSAEAATGAMLLSGRMGAGGGSGGGGGDTPSDAGPPAPAGLDRTRQLIQSTARRELEGFRNDPGKGPQQTSTGPKPGGTTSSTGGTTSSRAADTRAAVVTAGKGGPGFREGTPKAQQPIEGTGDDQ